jgi:hypothetical protein
MPDYSMKAISTLKKLPATGQVSYLIKLAMTEVSGQAVG